MPLNTPEYSYGGGPIGIEVGQRTHLDSSVWPLPDTATIYPRDVRLPTEARQRASFVRGTYGLMSLPVWMNGSARSFSLTNSALTFPGTSLWRTIRDLLYTDPFLAQVYAARFSCDVSGGFATAPGIRARQAYILHPREEISDTITALTLPDSRIVRRATSLWDFLSAADPVFISAGQNAGLVFRCLEPVTFHPVSIAQGRVPLSTLDYSIADAAAICIWNDARSLSDAAYIPPAVAVAPVSPGFDLSGGILPNPDISPVWLSGNGGAGIPVPAHTAASLGTSGGTWPSSEYPFGVTPSAPPAAGITYIGIFGAPSDWEILSNGQSLGTTAQIDLRDGWDTAGDFIRVPRRRGENSFSYAGRQQRLWLATCLSYQQQTAPGSSYALERQISAYTGRTAIIEQWDGHTATNLPSDTTRLDVLETAGDRDQVLLRLSQGQIIVQSSLVYLCNEDLSGFTSLSVQIDNQVLIPGRDWLLSRQNVQTVLLANPVPDGSDLWIIATGRSVARVTLETDTTPWVTARSRQEAASATSRIFQEDNTIFLGQTVRETGSTTAGNLTSLLTPKGLPSSLNRAPCTIAVSRGAALSTMNTIECRRLRAPGRAIPTEFGLGIYPALAQPKWSALGSAASCYGPPLDLDTGVPLV